MIYGWLVISLIAVGVLGDDNACSRTTTTISGGTTLVVVEPIHNCGAYGDIAATCTNESPASEGYTCTCTAGFELSGDTCIPEAKEFERSVAYRRSLKAEEEAGGSEEDGPPYTCGYLNLTECDPAALCLTNAEGDFFQCSCEAGYWLGGPNSSCIECDDMCGECSPSTGVCWSCAYMPHLPMNSSIGDVAWSATMICTLAGLHPAAIFFMGIFAVSVVIAPCYCYWREKQIEKYDKIALQRRTKRMEDKIMRHATMKIENAESARRKKRRERRRRREERFEDEQKRIKDKKLRAKRKQVMKQYQDAFDVFDQDESGTITRQELGIAMVAVGEHLEEEELNELFKEGDQDGNGTIEFPEFYDLMMKRKKEAASKKKPSKYAIHPEPSSSRTKKHRRGS